MYYKVMLLALILILVFPNVYAQQSTNQPCGTTTFDCYQDTGFRLDRKPVVCIDLLSDPTFGHKLNIYAINDVEEWYPNAQIISSKSSPFCNISIEFLLKPSPNEQASVSDAVGVTFYDYETHTAQIQIFCDALAQDSNGNSYFTDSIAPDYQLQWTIKHELGHAFGLGHYILTDDETYQWLYGSFNPPSIMLLIISTDATVNPAIFKGDVTPLDFAQLQSLYPNGYSEQESQAQTSSPQSTQTNMLQYYKDIIKAEAGHYKAYNYINDVANVVNALNEANLTSVQVPEYPVNVGMPSWFWNNLNWWANAKISDNDLASAIQYLYNNTLFYFS